MRRKITELAWEKLLESFRMDPEPGTRGSFNRAGEAADLDYRTAQRAWERGWPRKKPIRELVEVEKALARASLRREVLAQRLEEATRLAVEDAAESRAMAGKSVRMVNVAALNALSALHQEGIFLYERRLAVMMQHEDPANEKAVAARAAFLDIAQIVRRLATAAHTGQEMERLMLGEPTTILGGGIAVHPVTPINASAQMLVEEAQAVMRAAEEMRQLEAETKVVPQLEAKTDHGDGGPPPLPN